jgi:hypothetical protein
MGVRDELFVAPFAHFLNLLLRLFPVIAIDGFGIGLKEGLFGSVTAWVTQCFRFRLLWCDAVGSGNDRLRESDENESNPSAVHARQWSKLCSCILGPNMPSPLAQKLSLVSKDSTAMSVVSVGFICVRFPIEGAHSTSAPQLSNSV